MAGGPVPPSDGDEPLMASDGEETPAAGEASAGGGSGDGCVQAVPTLPSTGTRRSS